MAVLIDADRLDCWKSIMELVSRERGLISLTKPQLRAAIDAADDWASSNAASFNTALPLAARNNLTPAQKARLLALVLLKRYEKGA